MSATAERIALDTAQQAAAWLARRWWLQEPDCAVVGSIRRKRPEVGDIEFIAPLPPEGRRDELYERIAGSIQTRKAAGLFEQPSDERRIGTEVLGLSPGFKLCRLLINRKSGGQVQVEINRYTPGAGGNRGWTELRCTGPAEWGQAVLVEWKRINGFGPDRPGSVEGLLVDKNGEEPPQFSELHVFNLCRLLWIPPERRVVENGRAVLLSVDWLDDPQRRADVARGLLAAEIKGPDEARRVFGEQRYFAGTVRS